LLTDLYEKGIRMNGNAVYGERVVIVEVHKGNVSLKTGRISSTPSSHAEADNRSKTVVAMGDRQLPPAADSLDDASEKSFSVDDIHLLKEQEVQALHDSGTAQDWFGSIYQDWLVRKIRHALKRLKRT
jgi:hypothetical protein